MKHILIPPLSHLIVKNSNFMDKSQFVYVDQEKMIQIVITVPVATIYSTISFHNLNKSSFYKAFSLSWKCPEHGLGITKCSETQRTESIVQTLFIFGDKSHMIEMLQPPAINPH